MDDSVKQSAALREVVRGLASSATTAADADKAYKALAATCTACHDVYRNN
jgi:cytochrome c556